MCVSPACQIRYGPACDGNQTPFGKDTSGVQRPKFGSVPYGIDVSKCTVPGKVAMTFDDGPSEYTNDLLDVLKKNNAKVCYVLLMPNARII
jgi:peptidoglycan/xylan/chitin deacetylase (PgdA/CDA1 family)